MPLGTAFAQTTLLSDNWLFHQGSNQSHIPNSGDPSYYYFQGSGTQDTVGGLLFENTGAPFKFVSIDLYSSVTNIPYEFIGTLDSKIVFTAYGTAPPNDGYFLTVFNPYSSLIIDSLEIHLTNPASFADGNPVGFKDIVTVAANVPEPNALALLGVGFLAVLIRKRATAS